MSTRTNRRPFAWAAATGFGLGLAPIAPGSFGSLLALPAHVLVYRFFGPWVSLACVVPVTVLGVVATRRILPQLGGKDPGEVVVDEVAGQWLTLAFVPPEWIWLLVSFLVFRAFDIVKPQPCRRLEKLPGASGIMADDLMAGVYACGVVHLLRWFF